MRLAAVKFRDLFTDCNGRLTETMDSTTTLLESVGIPRDKANEVIELFLWFSFLGILIGYSDESFSYEYAYGIDRMLRDAPSPQTFVIHPPFRTALGCLE